MSLLERENLILRHWAGVHPASRYLLGRGPTGCDTAKPLIADDNDPEIQIIIDEASPRDRSWPPASAVPQARPAYPQDQSDPQSASTTSQHTSMVPNSPIAPTAAPLFDKQQGADFDSPYPDTRKYKPHPLYDQRPMFGDYPAHVSNFEQSVPPMAAERLLVKRESIYAPPPTQPSLSSLLSHQQRTDIPSHDYYPSQSRPSYSRPGEAYSSQPINGVLAEISSTTASVGPTTYHTMYPAHLVSWPDQYVPHSSSTPAPQIMNRRPQQQQQPASALTPLTPVIPPVGLTSNSGPNGSPSSQTTSASGSVPDQQQQQQRSSAIPADPMYAPRRSAAYGNGFPSSSGTPTPSSYMQNSQSTMYSLHGDGSQQPQAQQQQQQQQQRQRQYLDGSVNSESFRQ